jgi:hypothetical protein
MAHKLKVCEQFRAFTGLPMNLSACKSLYLQFSPSKISNVFSSDLEKIELVIFWAEMRLSYQSLQETHQLRGGPVILHLKICQLPLSKSLQKVPTSSFLLLGVGIYDGLPSQTIDDCTSHQGHETRNIVMLKEARVGKRLIVYTFSIR